MGRYFYIYFTITFPKIDNCLQVCLQVALNIYEEISMNQGPMKKAMSIKGKGYVILLMDSLIFHCTSH